MNYTEKLENSLFELWSEEDDIPEEKVIEFLNNQDTFRSFGDALKTFIRGRMPDKDSDEKSYLKQMAKQQNIVFNKNTLSGWFDGTRPKKDEKSREHMYKIAFALKLDISDTKELFQKVYYDRPFNFRNKNELIYYYCLNNKQSYAHALELISQVTFDENREQTMLTRMISRETDNLDEQALLDWIRVHPHNFAINSRSAHEILDQLLYEIKGRDGEKESAQNGTVDSNCSYIAREYARFHDCGEQYKNKTLTSVSTMLDIILGIDFVKERGNSGKAFFKNVELPKEIISRFPQKEVFSKENPSFEELRKMIILLYSYMFWYRIQYEHLDEGYDEYRDNLNEVLYSASLQELYTGNPYDWLFLFCSIQENPLDVFRDIIAEAFQVQQ